jgi:uncharacterized lipoprotein YehR (DUF1307 family)
MKKVLALVLALSLVFVLVSCGKTLSGTYSSGKVLGSGVSYTFKGNDVTVTYSIASFEKSINGTYEITTNDEDQEVIIFTFGEGEENADDYAGEFAFAEGKEGDTEYIKIGGVKYNKQ